MSKGDTPRHDHEAFRKGAIWCDRCGKMRGGACNCSPLPNHPTCNALAEACGYDVDLCKTCGNVHCCIDPIRPVSHCVEYRRAK